MSYKVYNKLFFIIAGFALLLVVIGFARVPAGDIFLRKGFEAKREWQLDKATGYFTWAVRLKPYDARARFEKGLSLQLRGNFLAAQSEFEILMQIDDIRLQAELFNAFGVNQFNFNESDRAIELHQKSFELSKQTNDRRLQAQSLINLSRVLYHSKGDGAKALEYLEQSLQIAREAKDEISEADALRNMGAVYWWHKGKRTRPLNDFYLPALAIYQRHNDLRGAAITLSNISLIYWFRGDAFQFLKHQSESIAIKERIGDMAGLSDSYLHLSWFYVSLQNYRKAHEYMIQSLKLNQSIGYRLGENDTEGSLAGIYIELREFDNAIEFLKRLMEREKANPLLLKYRVAHLGVCYRLKGDPITARQYFEQALALNKQSGSESEVSLLTLIGETYQDTNEWQKAEEHLIRAEEIGLQEKEKNWWHWLGNRMALARQKKHEGRDSDALKYMLEATEIETQLTGSNGASPVQGQWRQVYNQVFSSLLTTSNEVKNGSETNDKLAFRLLEQQRYRAFRNLVLRVSDQNTASQSLAKKEQTALTRIIQASRKLKDINSTNALENLRRAYSEYEDAVLQTQLDEVKYNLVCNARPAEIGEIQNELDDETAVIEYLYTEENVFALIITRANLRSIALPITRANLAAKVKLFRALIFDNASSDVHSNNARWLPVAEDLRSILIEPIEQTGTLTGKRKLGLVPFGFLNDLPFASLVRDKKFLIEDYTLFHLPSATFLKHSSRQIKPAEQTLLSFGINGAGEDGLQPLRFAEEEATTVAKLFNGQSRISFAATETELKQLAPDFRYIHLATHGVSEPAMPLLSRLKMKATADDDGNLTVREIFNLGLQSDLVTLGACRTGQSFSASGNQFSDIDRIGLSEAFLHSGTQSVLATLFPVEDRPTMEFTKTFYANLRTQDKAEALATTQRAALRNQISYTANNQTYQLTHPRHWAAFILAGDYR